MQNQSSKSISLNDRSYKFSIDIIELTNILPKKRSAWVIADQLIRSATSIGANMIEAKASSSRLEFKKFFEISLKSANETEYWLRLLRDTSLADKIRTEKLIAEVLEIGKMIGKSVITLKQKL